MHISFLHSTVDGHSWAVGDLYSVWNCRCSFLSISPGAHAQEFFYVGGQECSCWLIISRFTRQVYIMFWRHCIGSPRGQENFLDPYILDSIPHCTVRHFYIFLTGECDELHHLGLSNVFQVLSKWNIFYNTCWSCPSDTKLSIQYTLIMSITPSF